MTGWLLSVRLFTPRIRMVPPRPTAPSGWMTCTPGTRPDSSSPVEWALPSPACADPPPPGIGQGRVPAALPAHDDLSGRHPVDAEGAVGPRCRLQPRADHRHDGCGERGAGARGVPGG